MKYCTSCGFLFIAMPFISEICKDSTVSASELGPSSTQEELNAVIDAAMERAAATDLGCYKAASGTPWAQREILERLGSRFR